MAVINPTGSLPVAILSGASSINIDAWQSDRGLLIGSTTHMIGSTEGFIGNRLPATT